MKISQLPNGKWQASYYLGPKQRRVIHTNKKQLEGMANKEIYEWHQKKITPDAYRQSIVFEEACDKYLSLYAIPNGQAADRYSLPYFINFLGSKTKLGEIGVERLKELKAKMLNEYAPSTFNRRWTLLTGVFREAINNGYIKENPCKLVKKVRGADNKKLRYLTSDEVQRLLGSLETEQRLFALIALNTGFRLGNLLRLEWSHIDQQQNVIHALRTKSDRAYSVPINIELLNAFKCLKERKLHDVYILPRRNWGHIFRKIFRSLGWEDVSLHTFRHTFASHLVMRGNDLHTVSKLMGHSSIVMTQRYAHLSPKHFMTAVATLNFGETEGDRLLKEAKTE